MDGRPNRRKKAAFQISPPLCGRYVNLVFFFARRKEGIFSELSSEPPFSIQG